jgi:nicotinamide riboside kinase
MKFAISGAQGVGKSTLIKELQAQPDLIEGCVLITEIVRTLAAQGIKINKGADHKSQMIILEEHYKNTLRYDKMITDRCALDAFTYATWDYLNGAYTYEQHKEHEAIFLDTIKNYDLIFYIAPEFEIVNDGFRSTDAIYQKEIHELFLKAIRKYNLRVMAISGSVEDRMEKLRYGIHQFQTGGK